MLFTFSKQMCFSQALVNYIFLHPLPSLEWWCRNWYIHFQKYVDNMARVFIRHNDDEYVRSIVKKRLYYSYSDVIFFKHLFYTFIHIITSSLNTKQKRLLTCVRLKNRIKQYWSWFDLLLKIEQNEWRPFAKSPP